MNKKQREQDKVKMYTKVFKTLMYIMFIGGFIGLMQPVLKFDLNNIDLIKAILSAIVCLIGFYNSGIINYISHFSCDLDDNNIITQVKNDVIKNNNDEGLTEEFLNDIYTILNHNN